MYIYIYILSVSTCVSHLVSYSCSIQSSLLLIDNTYIPDRKDTDSRGPPNRQRKKKDKKLEERQKKDLRAR